MFSMETDELEAQREARRVELRALAVEEARIKQRQTELVREADDAGDWKAARCSSSAQWLALTLGSDHRTAAQITRTSDALRTLPALDDALKRGALSLDQVAAAAEFATPEHDAELARVAVGKAPREIGVVARTLAPPAVADDQALYRRRALSINWVSGRRELMLSGRLPLELGAMFEQAIREGAKARRNEDPTLEWQQATADSLVALATGPVTRSPTTVIVHVGDDAPPAIEGAGSVSPQTAERLACDARRMTIKATGDDLVHSRVGRCASYAQRRALYRRSSHCQYPGCGAALDLHAHHLQADAHGGKTVLVNLIWLCHRHHALLHDHDLRVGGTAEQPWFTDAAGREITAHRPHPPPC